MGAYLATMRKASAGSYHIKLSAECIPSVTRADLPPLLEFHKDDFLLRRRLGYVRYADDFQNLLYKLTNIYRERSYRRQFGKDRLYEIRRKGVTARSLGHRDSQPRALVRPTLNSEDDRGQDRRVDE